MPDCPASYQSGPGIKKLTIPGQVRYRIKPRQSGIFLVRYRTEIIDAGMPMPALVSWMPMPSYAPPPLGKGGEAAGSMAGGGAEPLSEGREEGLHTTGVSSQLLPFQNL
jgi:hypothetical protein